MGKLSKTLENDLENGVPTIIELSSIKINPNLQIYNTGRIKRKQRPKGTKKYPEWAKALKRNDRICIGLSPKNFEDNEDDVESHLKDTLGNILTEGTVVAYLVAHRVNKGDKKETERGAGLAAHYDVPGIFIARKFETLKYESDSEDSE
jgi:hypothetical protein